MVREVAPKSASLALQLSVNNMRKDIAVFYPKLSFFFPKIVCDVFIYILYRFDDVLKCKHYLVEQRLLKLSHRLAFKSVYYAVIRVLDSLAPTADRFLPLRVLQHRPVFDAAKGPQ